MNQLLSHTGFHKSGFTLLEAVIAAAILAVGCLGILAMLSTSQRTNINSEMRTDAVLLAERMLVNLEVERRDTTSVWSAVLNNQQGNWVLYGQVDEFGMRANDFIDGNINPPAHHQYKYCVAFYSRDNIVHSGAIRIYWRRDGNAIANNDCADARFVCFDAGIVNNANGNCNGFQKQNFEFVSFPYSI